jgi:hypothetical protein
MYFRLLLQPSGLHNVASRAIFAVFVSSQMPLIIPPLREKNVFLRRKERLPDITNCFKAVLCNFLGQKRAENKTVAGKIVFVCSRCYLNI